MVSNHQPAPNHCAQIDFPKTGFASLNNGANIVVLSGMKFEQSIMGYKINPIEKFTCKNLRKMSRHEALARTTTKMR